MPDQPGRGEGVTVQGGEWSRCNDCLIYLRDSYVCRKKERQGAAGKKRTVTIGGIYFLKSNYFRAFHAPLPYQM
ncbi:MAG: hypothetical protein D3922_05335 [Candidatus Electrothrix sp. AR1]|nr:hypothetical protein [Candidatus Electrothrix sp. AR1]